MSSTSGLALDALRFGYRRGHPILQDITATIPAGQFVCILGESGCGKSTLLRLIARLERPTSGSVSTAQKARLGFVFQEPALMDWRSVRGNIDLPLKIGGFGKQARGGRIDQALSLVGLLGAADRRPRELSGGMRMRASLARAIAPEPDILLMDEPFGALDEITRNRLNDDLLSIWARNKTTILFVTHSVQECAYLAERVIVMGRGRVSVDIALPDVVRDGNFRDSALFHDRCAQISAALQKARQEDTREASR